jgi:hypothetical protein
MADVLWQAASWMAQQIEREKGRKENLRGH